MKTRLETAKELMLTAINLAIATSNQTQASTIRVLKKLQVKTPSLRELNRLNAKMEKARDQMEAAIAKLVGVDVHDLQKAIMDD